MIYCRKDEHSLIAVYCQKLMDGQLSQLIPDSPMQVALEIDAEQRKELEFMIKELEQENANLKEEYNHLKIVGCQMPGMPLNPPDVTLGTLGPGMNTMNSTEAEMLAEAAMLREHRARLEGRMGLLEEHNRQLESQLGKLKQILEVRSPSEERLLTITRHGTWLKRRSSSTNSTYPTQSRPLKLHSTDLTWLN